MAVAWSALIPLPETATLTFSLPAFFAAFLTLILIVLVILRFPAPRAGMRIDFSWRASALQYAAQYRALVEGMADGTISRARPRE